MHYAYRWTRPAWQKMSVCYIVTLAFNCQVLRTKFNTDVLLKHSVIYRGTPGSTGRQGKTDVCRTTADTVAFHRQLCRSTTSFSTQANITTRRSQHSRECKIPNRHCFCTSWSWPLTFRLQNKRLSRTYGWTFISRVCCVF